MRIIAGKFRSRLLSAPAGADTRPSSDRLRETLFNVIASKLHGAAFLDLYAGSGAVGLEALSRGAASAQFVERSRAALTALKKNIAALRVEEAATIHAMDVSKALPALQERGAVFDFCFLDPPYRIEEAYRQSLEFLSRSRLLRENAVVIVEHDKHFTLTPRYGPLGRFRELRQGDSVLSFYAM